MKALILLAALFPPPEYSVPDRYGPPYYYYGPYDDRYNYYPYNYYYRDPCDESF